MDWEATIKQHGSAIHAIAYRITGSAADADDVIQEVLLEAIGKQRTGGIKNMPGWLRHRTTFRAIDRRRAMARGNAPLSEVLASTLEPPDQVFEQRELAESVRDLVASLPDRQATVFALHFFERMSHSEIASILSIEPNAVASAFYKIRQKIENHIHLNTTGTEK